MEAFQRMSYEEEFEEIKCVGRGNFGAAFLVKLRKPPEDPNAQIFFIAKKILLGQLTSKEQEGALLEANILKDLTHPNIVSYKGSFIDKGGILIIIMEFCEVGDLAFQLKRRKAKNEHLTETEIMNWFVQLCLALEYVHGQKILHRDIKSQNVFLTKNNTIKIGDFGISKVLENTNDQAMTVQGTPYYMSPEVCQNKPYTYKSDVWALGCILFELCTLKHAFNAENLLGLVFKIVQDTQEDIPVHYSKDMRELVVKLLDKDDKTRPNVIDILRMPFVQYHMQKFVESQGQINLKPEDEIKQQIIPEQAEQDKRILQSQDLNTLTAKQRMRIMKEQKAREEFEKLKDAMQQGAKDTLIAKQRKYEQLHGTFQGTQTQKQMIPSNIGKQQQQKMENTVQSSQFDDTFNNRSMCSTGNQRQFQESQLPGTSQRIAYGFDQSQGTLNQSKNYLQKPQFISLGGDSQFQQQPQPNHQYQVGNFSRTDFSLNDKSLGSQSLALSNTNKTNNDFLGTYLTLNEEERSQFLQQNLPHKRPDMTPISEKESNLEQSYSQKFDMSRNAQNPMGSIYSNKHDEKVIKTQGFYNLDQVEKDDDYEDDYEEDFEDYESDEEQESKYRKVNPIEQKKNKEELNEVVNTYKKFLTHNKNGSQDFRSSNRFAHKY